MPRLTITYADRFIYDGEVEEFTWTEAPGAVQVIGRTKRSAGNGLLDLLAATRKAKAQAGTRDTEDGDVL